VEKSREARQKAAPVRRNKQVSNQVRAAAGKQVETTVGVSGQRLKIKKFH
jgi:hypothetical protein